MTHDDLVGLLLYPCWRGISQEYKRRYSLTIWAQFESAIKAAAYTDRLPVFLEKLKRKLDFEIRSEHAAGIESVISSGRDRAVLKMLREETALLVIQCRVRNEASKEQI